MLEPLHFPHRWSSMCCAFWLLCGSSDDGESMTPLAASCCSPPPTDSFSKRKQLRYCGFRGGAAWPRAAHVEHSGCLLLLAHVVHVNPRSRVLVPPGSGGGDLQPSHLRRIVAPRFELFKARWCGVQQQAAAAARGGSAFTVGGAGRRHCGAPILRRYATTSAWLRSMAHLSAVLPSLQRRE